MLVVGTLAAWIALDLQAQIRHILEAAAASTALIPRLSLLPHALLILLVLHDGLAEHLLKIEVAQLVRSRCVLSERVIPRRTVLQVVGVAELAKFLQLGRPDKFYSARRRRIVDLTGCVGALHPELVLLAQVSVADGLAGYFICFPSLLRH